MAFFVSPKELPNWKTSPEELSTLLKRDWVVLHEKLAHLQQEALDKGVWIVRCGVYDVRCSVFEDGVAFHMDGDIVRSLLLAFWYRQFVPEHIELWLWSENGDEVASITKPFDELKTFERLFVQP